MLYAAIKVRDIYPTPGEPEATLLGIYEDKEIAEEEVQKDQAKTQAFTHIWHILETPGITIDGSVTEAKESPSNSYIPAI